MTEVRKTSETGGQKGQKDARFDLIAFTWLWEVANVCGMGAKKYDDDNWRKGYSWRLSYGAMQRHLTQFWTGENYDEESGLHHLAHAAWHCMVLFVFSTISRYKVFDDRPDTVDYKYGPQPEAPKANGCCAPSIYGNAVVSEPITIDESKVKYRETFLRIEALNGHEVKFKSESEGYIDGKYHRGTDFTAKVRLFRRGFNTIDEAMEADARAVTADQQ